MKELSGISENPFIPLLLFSTMNNVVAISDLLTFLTQVALLETKLSKHPSQIPSCFNLDLCYQNPVICKHIVCV